MLVWLRDGPPPVCVRVPHAFTPHPHVRPPRRNAEAVGLGGMASSSIDLFFWENVVAEELRVCLPSWILKKKKQTGKTPYVESCGRRRSSSCNELTISRASIAPIYAA